MGLWLGVTRLFALYIENFDSYKTVYGALAGAAIYLIFLFLTCVSLLIGAEVNEQMHQMRRARKARRRGDDRDPRALRRPSGLAAGAPVGGAVGVALAAGADARPAAAAGLAAAAVDPGPLAAPRAARAAAGRCGSAPPERTSAAIRRAAVAPSSAASSGLRLPTGRHGSMRARKQVSLL